MAEIIEHEENDQVVLQQTGKAVVVEEEKQTQKLRILLIDDSVVCLAVMSSQLRHWGFEVTPKREALEAIDLLRRNKNAFDIVFTDVVRFDLDGFHLSEIIKHQFGIPVIMISAKDDQRYIEEGMRCGATYYLVKPVQLDVLQAVCKLVIRNLPDNNNNNLVDPLTLEPSYFADGNENPNTKQSHDDNDRDDDDENKKKKKKKKNDGHVSSSSAESSSTILKKPRVVWDPKLHQKFVEVVLRLNVEKAVPKKILEMMNEPNLTRENIASHLQKFRNALRKERERFCQVLAKNPREDQQHFLNSTVQPAPLAPGLTIKFDNFCSGQEMIMSSNTNFNQQRSLHSAGNHFSQHHHLRQQQLIKNMATIESSNNSSSSLSKTSKTRKTFFMETEYPTIDYRNQKNMFDQEFAMKQVVVYPQDSALPYQETTSASSSSSSRGNNIGGHHHHQAPRTPRNVQHFQAASGGDVVPYQARVVTNVQPFQAVVGGDVVPYKARAPKNVQSFQGAVGGDVLPHHARTPTNVQPFQSVVGGADDHVVPYQARPPTNVQTFHAGGGGGGDVVVPYQTWPTNVQPSQAGGDGTGNSADTGNKVHLSSSIDDHVVHNYYDEYSPNTMELQPSSQSAGGYSIGGNNNDGYLMLPSIISSNIVPNQARSSQPNTSLEESIDNSIVPHQAMPTPQLFQPNTSVEKSIHNSIVPNQAMPTQHPSQPSTYKGGSIDDSIAGYQAMPSHANTSVEGSIDNSIVPCLAGPTQEPSQPTDSIGEFFDNSFVPYQAMPTHQPFQPTDSIGFIDNSIAPYQAWPTQPNTSLEESIDNSIIPYQAWPTQEPSQPADYIGGSIDFIVPYQAWHTQNSSHSSGSIGGNSGENNGHLLPSINSMVLYQDEHTKKLAQEINSFGGNNGQVGYTQPYITDHSCSFSSLFLSPDENSYFSENKYDYCMKLLPTNNTNADHVHDTSFVGKNINGYDHQMMNPLPATDSVAEVSSKNIEDLPDEEISFMINELSNYGTSPSIS